MISIFLDLQTSTIFKRIWETITLPTNFLCEDIKKNLYNKYYHNFRKESFIPKVKMTYSLRIKDHFLN